MGKAVSTAKNVCKKILPPSLYRHLVSTAGDCKRSFYALRSKGGGYSIHSSSGAECRTSMQF